MPTDSDSLQRPARRAHRQLGRGAARSAAAAFVAAVVTMPAFPQSDSRLPAAADPRQTQADAYTRYELLAPSSNSFRIVYDVTATTPGARLYFNAVRPGSEPTVHSVLDLATGKRLTWKLVNGEQAIADGLVGARRDGQYIRVSLSRPVPTPIDVAESLSPSAGEARLRIDKTYKDAASFHQSGDEIVFERSLGVKRNAVLLPAGYEVLAANYPVQVVTEDDGRVRLSFMNRGPASVPLRVVGRRHGGTPKKPAPGGQIRERASVNRSLPTSARLDYSFAERAFQDREIVYFLQSPETHSFRLYHDYTEKRPGVDRYLNVVRAGSKASRPVAWNLDTGERLQVETLRGAAITEKGIDIGGEPEGDTEVVVIWFEPVVDGRSVRLRIEETYTDPGRYGVDGDELVWDRSFGRPRNAIVLPPGWRLTSSAVPATISETDDGRIRLDFENDRPGNLEVFVKARLR